MEAHQIARGVVGSSIAGGETGVGVVAGHDDARVGALFGEGHIALLVDALLDALVAGGLWRGDVEHAHLAAAISG